MLRVSAPAAAPCGDAARRALARSRSAVAAPLAAGVHRSGVRRRAPQPPRAADTKSASSPTGILDRIRRAASSAAFFTASPLTWHSAAWGSPWWLAPTPATFSRDIDAERVRHLIAALQRTRAEEIVLQHRGPDRLVIFDGDDPASARNFAATWGTLDDVIAGGCSSSHVRLLRTKDGLVMEFGGRVSAAGGAGWASARTRDAEPPWDLAPFDGIRLRVRGDGQRFKLALRDQRGLSASAWEASFDTVAGEWCVLRLPWSAFRRGGFGVTWRDGGGVPRLRTRHVASLQLLLSRFDDASPTAVHVGAPCHERAEHAAHGFGRRNPFFAEGPFELLVQRIEAYRRPGHHAPKAAAPPAQEAPPAPRPKPDDASNEWVEHEEPPLPPPPKPKEDEDEQPTETSERSAALAAAEAAAEAAARASAGAAQAAQAAEAAEAAADLASAAAGRPPPLALPPAPPSDEAATPPFMPPELPPSP